MSKWKPSPATVFSIELGLASALFGAFFVPLAWSSRNLYEDNYTVGSAVAEGLVVLLAAVRGGAAAGLLIPDWKAAVAAVCLVCLGYSLALWIDQGPGSVVGTLMFGIVPGLIAAGLAIGIKAALVAGYRRVASN